MEINYMTFFKKIRLLNWLSLLDIQRETPQDRSIRLQIKKHRTLTIENLKSSQGTDFAISLNKRRYKGIYKNFPNIFLIFVTSRHLT